MSNQDLVREFHVAFGHPVIEKPQLPSPARTRLRLELIREETNELADAFAASDIHKVIDALGDLAYVVYGAALECGVDLDRAIPIIHASNMSKLGEDGRPIYREDGKVLKGPRFFEPDFTEMLHEQSRDGEDAK